MNYEGYKYLIIEKNEGIIVITFNRPDTRNALFRPMHREVEDVFAEVAEDGEVKAIVLTGAGRAFSAGGDIRDMHERADGGFYIPNRLRGIMRGGRRLVLNMLNIEIPIIAAVNGPAIGLGATIALFSDIIIASERARFGDTHVKVGLVAGDGGCIIWPLLVGVAKAKEMLMLGEVIDAQEALRIGLVNKVVPDQELMPTAMSYARRLANGPKLAISWTKMALNRFVKQADNLVGDLSFAWEGHTFCDPDHEEATRAFIEEREPKYEDKNWGADKFIS